MLHLALSDFYPSRVGLPSFRKFPFAFLAMKMAYTTLVISHMTFLIIPCEIFNWDETRQPKVGQLSRGVKRKNKRQRERETCGDHSCRGLLQREWRSRIIQQAGESSNLPALMNDTAPSICLLPSHLSALCIFKAFFHDLRFPHCSLRSKKKAEIVPIFILSLPNNVFCFKNLFLHHRRGFFPL